jgi:hypothetical protein
MKEINVTEQQLERAKTLYEFKVLNNSISKGKGNLIGAIGEIVVFDYYTNKGKNVIHAQNFQYDLIIENYKIECKTLASNVTPKDYYNCHLSTFNDKQDCDYYCFLHALNDFSKVWIKGMLSKHEVNQLKTFKKKGELDGKFAFKEDTWIIKNYQLKKI